MICLLRTTGATLLNTVNRLHNKTVQILGKGKGAEMPFPPNAERWGINDLIYLRYNGNFDNWTRWFDLHNLDRIAHKRPTTLEWYKHQSKPIYTIHPIPSIPHHVSYPKELILTTFKTQRFSSTFDWAMALAIHEEFEQIELCWCGMKTVSEYTTQVKNLSYWIGRAEERNIQVIVHGDSSLHPPKKLYGFETTYDEG
jgi:hypothetical protein